MNEPSFEYDDDDDESGPILEDGGPIFEDDDEVSCRGCGCTESEACEGGCIWATPSLCSACVRRGIS